MTEKVLIFDLDDTLVDTSDVYYRARCSFLSLLKGEGIDSDHAERRFEDIDSINISEYGFMPERYGRSMIDTYRSISEEEGLSVEEKVIREIKVCGRRIFEEYPKLIAGATELLEWARANFKMALFTRGLRELQMEKIGHVEIEKYFDNIYVTETKDGQQIERMVSEMKALPGNAWVIGDSIKSDINPGVRAGANCILYVYRHHSYYWKQEYGYEAQGAFYLAEKLEDVRRIIETPDKFEKVVAIE